MHSSPVLHLLSSCLMHDAPWVEWLGLQSEAACSASACLASAFPMGLLALTASAEARMAGQHAGQGSLLYSAQLASLLCVCALGKCSWSARRGCRAATLASQLMDPSLGLAQAGAAWSEVCIQLAVPNI